MSRSQKVRADLLDMFFSQLTGRQSFRLKVTPSVARDEKPSAESASGEANAEVNQSSTEYDHESSSIPNVLKNTSQEFLATDCNRIYDAANDVIGVENDDIFAMICGIIYTLLRNFIGSAKYGYESFKIWGNPKLSLVSEPAVDLIEEGKSIRFCRDSFFEMTSNPEDGDRIRSLSLIFHYRLMFLTHSYVISSFYCLYVLNLLLLLLALFINTTPASSTEAIGLIAIMTLCLPVPPLVSRIITYKWRGKKYSKFPLADCLLTMVPLGPCSSSNDESGESAFLRSVKFIENSSTYELINSVINFTLWKKQDILRKDLEDFEGDEAEIPLELLGSNSMHVWKRIESISLLSSRVFNLLIGLFPRLGLFASWGLLCLNVIMGFVGNFYIGSIPIYGINGNSKALAGSPLWIIIDFTYSALLIYIITLVASAFAIFCLSFHVHQFQIITFKQRLLMDRLRTARVDTNMKHILNVSKLSVKRDQKKRVVKRRNFRVSEQTPLTSLETKPMQWLDSRDLHEEYLYHQSVIIRSAQNWQLVVAVALICGISFFVVSLAALVLAQNFYIFIVGLVLMLFLMFVILRVAVLNSELDSIIGTLKSAASSDWVLYGGRDQLLKDFSLNPISFRMYGVEITFAWLITMVTGFVTANLSVFLIIYSTSLNSFQKSLS